MIRYRNITSACFRNSKWKFLEGVKASGAPLPRKIIVQQSIRDFGILEVLCNYVCTCPLCVYLIVFSIFKKIDFDVLQILNGKL